MISTKSLFILIFSGFIIISNLKAQSIKKTSAKRPEIGLKKTKLFTKKTASKKEDIVEQKFQSQISSTANFRQNTVVGKKGEFGNLKLHDKFIADAYLGFTGSFAQGDFIDYHKSFYDVTAPDTKVSGKIKPLYFLSFGTNLYFAPFYKEKGALSKLGINLGLGYVKRGFKSINSSEYQPSTQDLIDKTVYSEQYRLNYLTGQLSIRYGKKVFAEIGLIYDNLLGSTRKVVLEHEVSGSDAYNGGFKSKTSEINSLDKSIMNKSGTGYIISFGWQFSHLAYMRLSYNNSGKVFNEGANFKTRTLQFQLAIPFYTHSFFK